MLLLLLLLLVVRDLGHASFQVTIGKLGGKTRRIAAAWSEGRQKGHLTNNIREMGERLIPWETSVGGRLHGGWTVDGHQAKTRPIGQDKRVRWDRGEGEVSRGVLVPLRGPCREWIREVKETEAKTRSDWISKWIGRPITGKTGGFERLQYQTLMREPGGKVEHPEEMLFRLESGGGQVKAQGSTGLWRRMEARGEGIYGVVMAYDGT